MTPNAVRFLVFVVFLTAGCSQNGEDPRAKDKPTVIRSFSAEDKRIAKKLSVGAVAEVKSDNKAFDAIACQSALATLEEISSRSNLLSPEQSKAFELARAAYKRRELAAAVSPEERAKVVGEVELAYPDEGNQVRLAMSCLRALV